MSKSQSSETMLKQLKQPFDQKFVKFRVGKVSKDGKSALAFAYLDAREVYKRLDDVCGLGGWSSRFIELKDGFICELSIKMPDGEWITKSDTADFTDIESIKGGASSALKRAAAVWGVGRYLYYLPTIWCPINNFKQLTATPQLPKWATPKSIERWEDIAELELDLQEPQDVTSNAEDKKEKIRSLNESTTN